jgi:hypothetical protein
MPVPIVAVGGALKVASGVVDIVGAFGKTPSEKRAGKVVGGVLSSALQGNLTAVKCIRDRTTFGISAERAVWNTALQQIPRELLDQAVKYAAQIPAVDHSTPESAASTAIAREFHAPAPDAKLPSGEDATPDPGATPATGKPVPWVWVFVAVAVVVVLWFLKR